MKLYLISFLISALLIFSVLFFYNGNITKTQEVAGDTENADTAFQEKPSHKKTFGRYYLDDFYRSDTVLQNNVDSIFRALTIDEKAAQLIMPATSQYNKIGIPYSQIKAAYSQNLIGGVLYLKGKKTAFKTWITELNALGKKGKLFPLLSSCDCEPTLFHKKFTDADSLTATNFLTTDIAIKRTVQEIDNQMKDMGIQLNFAPIADIAINQEVINTRSFSSDPQKIIQRAGAFVIYSQSDGIATTLKHFPGHGAVVGDSHKGSVYINGDLTEVITFQKIIAQTQPIAVMVGHISIRHNKNYSDSLPATLSHKVITELLKEQIGFKGIVVTDAMQMQAIKLIHNSSFRALQAGADLIIMPQDIELLHNQIVKSLEKRNDFSLQLESSIKKIIRLKICTGRLMLKL